MRKTDGIWQLKDVAFTEEWTEKNYRKVAQDMRKTLENNGIAHGAFFGGRLVGFESTEGELFGKHKEYCNLSYLIISNGYRGRGIGSQLFQSACDFARKIGAKRLYISGHSSEETQSFYKKMGCREAQEYNMRLFELEPYDCQLEYDLY